MTAASPLLRDHAIFGGCLRSEFVLPELPSLNGASPDWVFRRANAPLGPARYLGEDSVDATIRVQCSEIAGGYRLAFDDTGTFDIADGGRDIAWTPGTAPMELVRADLLGGVFSVALHLQGLLCLHGSGVGIDGTAVAFLANKGGGKSTLATAMCDGGATLVTDDMLPVDRARSEPPLEDPEAFAKARTEAGAAGLPEGGREAEGPESAAAASASPAPEVTPLPLED